MAGKNTITSDGLKKLKEELDYLRDVRRKEIGEQLKEARAHGDLSENSEYDEARDAQSKNESRISELIDEIENSIVVDNDKISTNSVSVGLKVRIQYIDLGGEDEFDLVGTTEANPKEGRISDHSPIGKALIGASVGDTVTADTPSGQIKLKVLEIGRT